MFSCHDIFTLTSSIYLLAHTTIKLTMENQDLSQIYRIRFHTLKYLNAEGMWITKSDMSITIDTKE